MAFDDSKRNMDISAATKELNDAVACLGDSERDGKPDKSHYHKIVEAAQKILSAAKEPSGMGMEAIGQLTLITANRIFWEWGVFNEIPFSGSISYAELAVKVDADAALLGGPDRWRARFLRRPGTDWLRSNCPHSESLIFTGDDPAGCTYLMAWDNAVGSYATLPQYFQRYGRKEPQTQNHVPVTYGNGTPELTYYDILRDNPRRREIFLKAMLPLEASMPIAGMYDFSWVVSKPQDEPDSDRPVFVDVGGGKGQAIKAIQTEFPGLPLGRCVLQDLPEVIASVEALDDPKLHEVRKMAIDFHRDQPVKGALVYWIRRCLHNYGDIAVINILKHLAGALADDSRLLINEDILASPLGPTAAVLDMMMMNFGGKQRTLECWERVAREAGLQITEVSRGKINSRSMAVLECMRIQT